MVSIEIEGNQDYTLDDIYFEDAKVVIKYHILSDINPPMNASDAIGRNYQDVVSAFENAGFGNVSVSDYPTTDEGLNGKVKEVCVGWFDDSFITTDKFYPDYDVTVVYWKYDSNNAAVEREEQQKKSEQEQKSKEQDLIYDARDAFECYGENEFPYGFKCRWLKESYAQTVEPNGEVFLKVGVSITNAFGAKYDTIAEGRYSGSRITYFYVY